jgi:hypothetical protein
MGNQNRLIFIPMRLKDALNERKYYVTYNKGRGQGKGLEKEFDQKSFSSTDKPKVFNSYNDAKKYAEKMEKMFQHSIGGGTAYWVSDEKMNPIKESVNEGDEKSPEEILRGLREMAMGDLERIEDYAEMISDRMKEGQELSSWMYSQITLAVDQLNAVHDAMDGKDGVKESVNEEKVYIDYLNKAKGFKQDRIKFDSYDEAVKWARKNFDKFSPDMIKYESVNEGREVKAIQSDFNKTVAAIETEIRHYKKTKGTPQEKKHIDNLKKLHPIKKKLESELESAVSGLYKDAELKIED